MTRAPGLLACPFCGTMVRRVISRARSFNPPRDYIEWHHDTPAMNCYLYNIKGPVIASTADNTESEANFIAAWNRRPTAPASADVADVRCDETTDYMPADTSPAVLRAMIRFWRTLAGRRFTQLTAALAESERLRALLADPAAVRVNLLRGTIAKPDDLIFMHDTNGPYAKLTSQLSEARAGLKQGGIGASLLHKVGDPLPPGCCCKPGECMAPKIMGRQMPCRDPEKAAQSSASAEKEG